MAFDTIYYSDTLIHINCKKTFPNEQILKLLNKKHYKIVFLHQNKPVWF